MGDLGWVVAAVAAVALLFAVVNGFLDARTSIATVVSTRVLSARTAVVWAAVFNVAAMFLFAPKVAETISRTVSIRAGDPAYVYVVLCGLVGAIVWDLLTLWWGVPTSSSHALIGGLAGAGIAHAGWDALDWDAIGLAMKFIPLAPLTALVVAFLLILALYWAFRRWRPAAVERLFQRGQLVSAALYWLGHGANDAQKAMGAIVALLIASGSMKQGTPLTLSNPQTLWIILSCYVALGIGTALGGWRSMRTMGMKITKLRPIGGFSAETGGAFVLFAATYAGIPVSSTQTITGSVIGVGATKKLSGIKWGLATRIVWAWILTIPAAALVAAGCYWVMAQL